MSFLKFARTAAAVGALTLMPAQTIAASAAPLPVLAAAAVQADEAEESKGHPFFADYLLPTIIVIVIAISFYFLLEDEGEPPVSS